MLPPIQVVLYFQGNIKSFNYLVERSEVHWKEDLAKYKESLSSEEITNQFGYRRDLWASFDSIFPQYQRQSYLIMLMAMFEDFLNQLSFSVEKHCKLKICLSDYKGVGIDRAKKYLKKETTVNLPTRSIEWRYIKDAYEIRNIIVHNGGCLIKVKHKKQLDIISRNISLAVEDYARNMLVIKQEYLLELIRNAIEFTKMLVVKMQENEELKFKGI